MIPKNRIRLSRYLRAQTSPYPEASRWLRRGLIALGVLLAAGIYLIARPHQTQKGQVSPKKQILGEQKPSAKTEYERYAVKRGDTLFNLSQKYEVSWQTLAEINNLAEPYVLKIGQELKIPPRNSR